MKKQLTLLAKADNLSKQLDKLIFDQGSLGASTANSLCMNVKQLPFIHKEFDRIIIYYNEREIKKLK